MIRVVIADDQDLIREGIVMILQREPDIDVVGQARDGLEAIRISIEVQPDVVLMDVRMPHLDGVAATRRLTSDEFASDPDHPIKVLILTTYNAGDAVRDALRNGASGFALKDRASVDLVAAIRAVASGDAWLDPAVTMGVIHDLRTVADTTLTARQRLPQLTPREGEVLALMARGLSNPDICQHLVLSEGTIKTHVGRILMKLGAHDRAAAVALAYQSGFVQAPRLPPQE